MTPPSRWAVAGLAAAVLLLAARAVPAEVAVPPLAARVTDLTGTLRATERSALESKLAAFEERKGSQIAVLIVPTTAPETVEQYGIRVAEKWKLGRKGVDDGALLLVAQQDRTLRIEVGYGLEGALPDAVCKRIIDEIIVPRFRAGRFFEGIDAGVSQMIAAIDGEPLPPPPSRRRPGGRGPAPFDFDRVQFAFVTLAVVGVVFQFMRLVLGRLQAALLAGGIAAIVVWLLFWSLVAAAVVAILLFLFVLFGETPRAGRRGIGRSRYGGWSGGGYGGGFGGGGGGFGGGGASGRW